ncbi:Lipoteichoic acid synthase-like YvgJ [Tolypocladium ophioglossoides CBS 100239]|uniref:Lipoteichoic acid synthase-like YvgJ n=1 Tax=Tolypocladium ophioglossoides (strain CBS 100239) TaxID=1163406 RepID=A0A0L0NCM1_TOLOC|nr:Lipoteichoic acid synthase-like YvgJ [Tolypocladium ophioglossoides CBS 100239]
MAYHHDRHDSRHRLPRRSSSPSRCRLDMDEDMASTNQRFAGTLASVRFASRRIALALTSRFANRRFAFATAAVAIIGAKAFHLYAHFAALPTSDVLRYGLSFFAQDAVFLLVLRLLLDGQLFANLRWLRIVTTTLATAVVLAVLFLAAINISFFVVAGSEIHWRNIAVAGDSSSWTMLLTGLFSCSLVLGAVLLLAWALQDFSYIVAGLALDIIKWPLSFLISRIPYRRWRMPRNVRYEHIPQHDVEGAVEPKFNDDESSSPERGAQGPPPVSSRWMVALYVLVGLTMLVQAVTTILRPDENSLSFMSWTLPLLPFVDFAHSSPTLATLLPFHGSSINFSWDNRTALADPVRFSWLPEETSLPGFEDWYENREHYRASEDPLKISNMDDELLPELRHKLQDVNIRHVMLIKLESTRKDVFPIKKDGLIWNRLTKSFKNGSLPQEARDRLATLTRNANFLTGDYGDGFEHADAKQRGGINVNNAHTTSTYTLKSLAGTICGLTPLVADFNVEQSHHFYQPCLPHIFNALNKVKHGGDAAAKGNFTSFKWRSMFVQSVTDTYDKQYAEMPVLGYTNENLVTKEYLQSDSAKFGKVNMSDINYYGMPEIAIKDYIRDAFASAKKNDERVFLSHLTSTTHHPFGMPEDEKYIPLASEKKLDDLSHYINAVGYVDRWLGQILEVLEQEGVADETLLVLVGDHGLSIAENGGITPYYNSNIGNFHVPMVLSHPKLPHVDINDAVVSLQILPTILDLLMETGSLSQAEKAAAHDLVRNYEGQSLIRPLRKSSDKTGQGDWQYTVMNPGRATLSVRDARIPNYRLIVPIVDDTEWRFTDLAKDPHEEDPILSFGFISFLRAIEKKHGIDASKWAEEGAFMTRWWVEENNKRWRYDPN